MSETLRLSRTLTLLVWNEGVRERMMSYWRSRGFIFTETTDDFLKATRGSLWGNLTAFDSKKLLCTLSIARTSHTEVLCLLEIDTRYQIIVEWNRRYWELEFDTLESFLFRNDLREQEWRTFERDSSRAFALWMATGGLLGRHLTDRWRK
jgi:hypothetical protein